MSTNKYPVEGCTCLRCQITRRNIEERNKMKTTMTRRFYVGSTDMARTFLNNGEPPANVMLLGDAIEKGIKIVENSEHDAVFIVEIVKVIRKASQPVIVEDVI